jgi:staphylococcal nuclease domain-containing protein 1
MEHDYFIGSITTIDGQQAALMLVQAGFAKFYKPTPNVPNDKQSFKKKERITIEVHCKQPLSTNIYESEIINFNDPEFHRVVLTYITSELTIYVQYSEQGQKLEQLQNQLREIFNEKTPIGEYTPKKGELLAARFTADDQWYRAKVEKIEENNHIFVYFIDYGNREVITDLTRITTLPSGRFLNEKFSIKIYLFRFFGIT